MQARAAGHEVLWGGVLCALFCVLAVVVRGVRWDETWEHAQVLAGTVPYPTDHPLAQYLRSAFSLQTYLSAAMVALGAGPMLVCGLRNVMFLWCTVLPVYALVTALMPRALPGSRRVLAGVAGALLVLQGIYLEFDGVYPMTVWPDCYSNGAIGQGLAIAGIALFASGHARLAFFLVGLMPCLHIGQVPPLWFLAGWVLLVELWRRRWSPLASGIFWWGIGLACCAPLWLFTQSLQILPAATGPFAGTGDSHALWQAYTAWHDPHRQLPGINAAIAIGGLLVVVGMRVGAAGRHSRIRSRRQKLAMRPWSHLGCYGAGLAAIVGVTMTVQHLMGPDTPFLVIGWMPYRLLNHAAPLVLAAVVAVLGRERPGPLLLAAVLMVDFFRPWLMTVIPPDIYRAYLTQNDGLFFALYGAALAAMVGWRHSHGARGARVALAVPVVLLFYHRFGAACVIAGAFAFVFILSWSYAAGIRRILGLMSSSAALGCACILVAAMCLAGQGQCRQDLPASDFDRQITRTLAEQGRKDAMLLAPPQDFLVQARTGHPVLVDAVTPSLISYVPRLAAPIDSIYRQIYGHTFAKASVAADSGNWKTLWSGRTQEVWVAIATQFGFRYVIAPLDVPLNLPKILEDKYSALYEAPVPDAPLEPVLISGPTQAY